MWYGGWGGQTDAGYGSGTGSGFFFLYICFIDKRARGKTAQASPPEQDQQEEGKKKTGLEQTANDSDVWFTLLFTSFAVACPFSTQHSALSCLHSLAQHSRVLPGPSCAGPRPPLQALYVCVCVCGWVGVLRVSSWVIK